MSHWVHVAAIVRLDALRIGGESFTDDIKAYFGKSTDDYPCDWENDESLEAYGKAVEDSYDHPDEWLPGGSEGTCSMQVWEAPDESSLAAYTVSIFGDLRDVDTGDHILEWFEKKLSDEALDGQRFFVRQAVISVEEEYTNKIKTWAFGMGKAVTSENMAK